MDTIADRLAAALARVEELERMLMTFSALSIRPDSSGWLPIDTAPKDGTEIVASGLDDDGSGDRYMAVMSWDGDDWQDEDETMHYFCVTHWLPTKLPSDR